MYWLQNYATQIDLTGAKSLRKIAKAKNAIEFQNTFARCFRDAISRYEITGLPETISQRVVLMALACYGSVIFFERDGRWLALPGGATENFNIYGDPMYGWVWGRNGYNERIRLYIPGGDDDDFLTKGVGETEGHGEMRGVFIRENAICFPFMAYAYEYASAISDSMRTLDVCRQNIKQPYIITAEEAIVNSVKEFFKTRNENVEAIISSGVFPADKISLLPFSTNADNLKNATDMIEWYWNQWDMLCGKHGNANPDKKERLIVDEVNSGNEKSDENVESCIKYIQEGLNLFNEISGYNAQCVSTAEEGKEENNDDIQRLSENDTGNETV